MPIAEPVDEAADCLYGRDDLCVVLRPGRSPAHHLFFFAPLRETTRAPGTFESRNDKLSLIRVNSRPFTVKKVTCKVRIKR